MDEVVPAVGPAEMQPLALEGPAPLLALAPGAHRRAVGAGGDEEGNAVGVGHLPGADRVEGVLPAGVGGEGQDGSKLNAERMTAYRAEGRVVFEGSVSMRFYPNSAVIGAGNEAASDQVENESTGDPQ